jgi:hypothetical protein
VCQPGGLFGLNTGRGSCRGPGWHAISMRVGDSQYLQMLPKTLRLTEPLFMDMPHGPRQEPRPVFRPNRSPT